MKTDEVLETEKSIEGNSGKSLFKLIEERKGKIEAGVYYQFGKEVYVVDDDKIVRCLIYGERVIMSRLNEDGKKMDCDAFALMLGENGEEYDGVEFPPLSLDMAQDIIHDRELDKEV